MEIEVDNEISNVFDNALKSIDKVDEQDRRVLVNAYIKEEDSTEFIINHKELLCFSFEDYHLREDCEVCKQVIHKFNKDYKALCRTNDSSFEVADHLFSFYQSASKLLDKEFYKRKNNEAKVQKLKEERELALKRKAKKTGKIYIEKIEDFKPIPPVETSLRRDYYFTSYDEVAFQLKIDNEYHENKKKIFNSLSPIIEKIGRAPASELISLINELKLQSKKSNEICSQYQNRSLLYASCSHRLINFYNENEMNKLIESIKRQDPTL
jgi:hypothetical protein